MNKQSKSGITLIALIITIIVMLILVGVTVTVAINGGLFEKAKEAAKGTTKARVKEQMMGDITTKIAEKLGDNITESELETIAQKYGTIIEKDGIKYLKLTDGGYEVPLSEIWQVETVVTLASLYCDEEGCTNAEHLHKGDYVEYRPKTEQTTYAPDKGEGIGKYTGCTWGAAEQSIPQENLNWRVLGKDDKGNILLISGTPTIAGLNFYGHVGYNNFEDVLNDACKALYSNTDLGTTARSITMKDIDDYLGGSNFDKTKYGGGSRNEGGYGYQATISSNFDYDKNRNETTKLADDTTTYLPLKSNKYAYGIGNTITDNKNKEILQGTNSAKPYYNWVATRMISVSSTTASWQVSYVEKRVDSTLLINSLGSGFQDTYCIRPVVILPSWVTANQVGKETAKNETWNDPLGKYGGALW